LRKQGPAVSGVLDHATDSKIPPPPEPTMRQERTVQPSIFDLFAQHEIGCELKAMSDWLEIISKTNTGRSNQQAMLLDVGPVTPALVLFLGGVTPLLIQPHAFPSLTSLH
jgi:hypothetical protein